MSTSNEDVYIVFYDNGLEYEDNRVTVKGVVATEDEAKKIVDEFNKSLTKVAWKQPEYYYVPQKLGVVERNWADF